ncbi:Palmitoyltransferase [Pleurotus pulmonarius]|nr:Palmitoyltransferase [Pleurotus pulmonarius]
MHPVLGRIIVNFVLCLICFIAYSSQIFIIWPWYGREVSVDLLILLVPFNILVGMLLWNYFLTVTTDPGGVPDNWQPDTTEDGYEVKKLTGKPRYCRFCEKPKPPRAHHCKECKRCILRMDHHCPWVNNCVGHFNYGHFIRFLFYVDLSCSYHLVMVTSRVRSAWGVRVWDEPSASELIFMILNYVACVPVLLSVGGFSIYHLISLLRNTTTIEGWEKDKAATMVRRGKIREVKFPYNLGRRRNLESVLGTKPWLWCWPTVTPGTGLKYDLAENEDTTVVWPPEDPDAREYDDNDDDGAGQFELPESPWTYENGALNPNLQPYNSELRTSALQRRRRRQNPQPQSNLNAGEHADESSESEGSYQDFPRKRRGSEGYEIRPVDRNEMLKRYLEQIGEAPGRYHRYIPQPESDSEDDGLPLDQTPVLAH